ncbi:cell division protein FtsA [Limosilactobacillus fastidiosus]|uniref:Cell division protein FtsA n=1 Tax=Limosilactobacillus fastidiosus TaxID=2759855 RepID=A0A7W3TXT3_9LACO|nr:cell division protein FtsA [Limosilactobacillus fastidiosus]MBB1062358.1 cell division protein FtsA [Limosilactobacillus fastidiosus]MBB1085269.1 cell division protein FtsA [Limosilactobacillus fastidiosus]MCD7083433.1 cell division protein FtsA [Limosilactobacillus fastidiosus]MCD7085253.1 cell division protein FtsA [Limosilactobacillus fastidiosus]MCD7115196.1 cell division protein FtsA [Limosilactobacillus fastidiosus]
MDNSEVYVGLDIGTTSIKALVCENVKGQIRVIGVGVEPAAGMSRGVIVDIDKTARAISSAIAQAEEKSNIDIKEVIVGLPANYLQMQRVHGMITIANNGQSREIVDQDVLDLAREALTQSIPPERTVIDLVPTEFTVDGFDGIKDPRGMVGVRLEMKGTLYTGPKTIVHNAKKAIQQAGYTVRDFVVTPIATGFNLLNDGEQDFGTLVIDLGGGQTTTSIIHDHQLKYSYVDPEGGQYITKDISTVLNTSLKNAEQLKRDHGFADSTQADDDVQIDVTVVGQDKPVQYSEKYLSEVIEARIRQIFDRIARQLDRINAPELPGGVILIGGVAALPGIRALAKQYFSGNVKVFVPEQMGIRHPRFAISYALALYEDRLSGIDRLIKQVVQEADFGKTTPDTNAGNREPQSQRSIEDSNNSVQKRTNQEQTTKKKDGSFSSKFKSLFNNLFD